MIPSIAWPASLRRRFDSWVQARQPQTDVQHLTHRNVYILPTKAGLLFGLTVATLLVASINYQLNLGYALTFLLAGSAIVSMHWTHKTLRGLTLHLRPVNLSTYLPKSIATPTPKASKKLSMIIFLFKLYSQKQK